MRTNIRLHRAAAVPALAGLAMAGALLTPAPSAAQSPADPGVVRTIRIVPGPTLQPIPRVLPVEGYRLTGRFADQSGLWSHDHTGLDFAAAYGAPIRSIGDGVVVSSEYDGAYGLKTVVRLDDGTELWYCHQDSSAVAAGDDVSAGEEIGAIGTSGNTTGPHLHLEVRPHGGDPVDPEATLRDWGLRP